jgi:tyrosinase
MSGEMVTRSNFKELSDLQKQKFIEALRILQQTKQPGSKFTIYEKYVSWHVRAMSIMSNEYQNKAHGGPIFLPWHREFLRRFEKDLQNALHDTSFGLPYWNWIEDENNPQGSDLWKDDFMGGNGNPNFEDPTVPVSINRDTGYIVTTGPFKYDPTNPTSYMIPIYDEHGNPILDNSNNPIRIPLLRWFRIGDKFPTAGEITDLKTISVYDTPDWYLHSQDNNISFRNTLEGWKPPPYSMHNNVHVWVGGTMTNNFSPGDPVFFMNHCNVDRLWAEWQQNKSNKDWYPEQGQVASHGIPINGHNRMDKMYPWNNLAEGNPTVEDVLDHHQLGYKYDTEAV